MSLLPAANRTLAIVIRDLYFVEAADALCLQAKNLKNATVFIIRNVVSALEDNGCLKAKLSDNQKQALAEANAQVKEINEARKAAFPAQKSKNPKAKLKLLKEFGAANPTERARPFQILDQTLLENILHAHPDQNGFNVYGNLPAVVAQQIIDEVIESFKSWFKALKAYKKNPGKFIGRPRMPNKYRPRHGRSPITFHAQCLEKKAGYQFVALGKKTVYRDYGKTREISVAARETYANYPLDQTIKTLLATLPAGAELCEVRITSRLDRSVKLEAVFEIPMVLPTNSYAQRTYAALATQYPELQRSEVNDKLLEELGKLSFDKLPRIAGLDPGVNNFVTVAYSTGHRGMVVSNERIENNLGHFDIEIDYLKSILTPTYVKTLQAKRDQGIKLTEKELKELKHGFSALYAEPCLRHVQEDRGNWLQDALHKVSAGIVRELLQRGIEVLVIGHNKLWKDESEMGRRQNRRFHSAAHTRLFELLKYKCLEVGILVVETEESYTSKRSFALNEDLPQYDPKAKCAETEAAESTTEDPPPAGASQKPCMQSNGRRGTGAKRHEYKSKGAAEGWQKIHADINGALNIIRKVFKSFHHHMGLSSKFWLYWLSPKAGLAPMRLNTG